MQRHLKAKTIVPLFLFSVCVSLVATFLLPVFLFRRTFLPRASVPSLAAFESSAPTARRMCTDFILVRISNAIQSTVSFVCVTFACFYSWVRVNWSMACHGTRWVPDKGAAPKERGKWKGPGRMQTFEKWPKQSYCSCCITSDGLVNPANSEFNLVPGNIPRLGGIFVE